jgi:uncharacterized repeat protein (TIGR02543 family)
MKRLLSIVLVLLILAALPVTATAAGSITLSLSEAGASAGDEITVSGTAGADTWITLEGTDADGNILYFSAVLSDSSGSYIKTFIVPDMDDGMLTISAGSGNVTASAALTVYSLFTVTFNKNGGDTEADPNVLYVKPSEAPGTLPTAPTRSGYTFNGWNTSSNGSGSAFTAATAVTADLTVYAQWTKNSTGGSSSTSSVTTSTSTVSAYDSKDGKIAAVKIISSTNSGDSSTTAVVTAENITSLIEAAENNVAGLAGISVIEITVISKGTVKSVSVSMPAASLQKLTDSTNADIKISTNLGTIFLNEKAAESMVSDGTTGSLSIRIAQEESDTLSDAAKAVVGSRPIYALSVTSGDTIISDFSGGIATVSIPYTLATGEDANEIVIYYITASGELVTVPNCVYDAATGSVTFTTTHFSNYAIGYNAVSFSDVSDSAWYADYVSFLAARDIVGGNDGTFSPDSIITRAEFATILARMSGDDLSGYTSSVFTDVAASDWYFAAVQRAYENGVAYGYYGKFNPNATITRQDIAVMLARYAEKVAGYTLPKTNSAVIFTDSAKISAYASDAVTAMQQAGIIGGNPDGSFAPTASATRAQAAKMIAVLLQRMIKAK